MPDQNASLSGSFTIGGDMTVHRLGLGSMRITAMASGPTERHGCRPCDAASLASR